MRTSAAHRLPALRATIERRIFVTFRADPGALRPLVPDRYELRLTAGHAVGGVCLLRLGAMRPSGAPRWIGFGSESAAHRISIVGRHGEPAIWAPRRDTDSLVFALLGDSLYPGMHRRAEFSGELDGDGVAVRCVTGDGAEIASVSATPASTMPPGSIFQDVDAIAEYYRSARTGYSPSDRGGADHRIVLDIDRWPLSLLDVHTASSTLFDPLVARGDAVLDHAVLLRDVPSTWRLSPDAQRVAQAR